MSTTDFLNIEGQLMELVVRDQKTSKRTGSYKSPVPDLVRDLMMIWLNECRKPLNVAHKNVFMNLNTMKPYDQQGFSKFTTRAFKNVTGEVLNLQIIRRVFVNGVFFTFSH